MTTFANALATAAVAVTVAAVVVLWRRRLRSILVALSAQGVALAVVAALLARHEHDASLLGVAALVLAIKAVVIPGLLARVVATPSARESDPLVNVPASLVAAGLLTLVAFVAARPIVAVVGGPAGRLVPFGLATVLIGFFVMIARTRAISQIVGLLMVDNGVALIAFLVTSGVPLIVELGATLDVLFGVVVLRLLLARLVASGLRDLDQLRSLHD